MKKIIIIAEIGVNHNGSLKSAKKLIDYAYAAGADYAKFQTYQSEDVVTIKANLAKYQSNNVKSKNQLEMLKKYQLSREDFLSLKKYSESKGINFFSTAFDCESLDYLKSIGQKIFKIPSGEISNLPLLKKIGSFKKEVIISSGMSSLKEIRDAIQVLKSNGTKKSQITVLHCTSEYPAPFQDLNLNAIETIKNNLKINVGYSDHSKGIEIPIAIAALGVKIIEKHLTLNKKMKGPDHKASLEPKEFLEMVKSIRKIELSMGNGVKKCMPSERENKYLVRKSIVAGTNISKGEKFTSYNITAKRPGNGISPMKWNYVLGKLAKYNFKKDDLIIL